MGGAPHGRALVVNADDLGLHGDIDRGVETAHRDGVVTSASICAVGDTFDDALAVAERCPELDLGVHLTLVEERPLTDPARLGGLVTGAGLFPAGHAALTLRALTGRLRREAIRTELEAQIARVLDAGIAPTHLDSHQHVHLLPPIWPVVVELARRHGVAWIRVPAFVPLGAGRPGPVLGALRLGLNALQRLRRRGLGPLRTLGATPALGSSGHLTVATILEGLRALPPGCTAELVTHPGVTTPALAARYRWGFDWTGETAALTDPALRSGIAEAGFALRAFSALAA